MTVCIGAAARPTRRGSRRARSTASRSSRCHSLPRSSRRRVASTHGAHHCLSPQHLSPRHRRRPHAAQLPFRGAADAARARGAVDAARAQGRSSEQASASPPRARSVFFWVCGVLLRPPPSRPRRAAKVRGAARSPSGSADANTNKECARASSSSPARWVRRLGCVVRAAGTAVPALAAPRRPRDDGAARARGLRRRLPGRRA